MHNAEILPVHKKNCRRFPFRTLELIHEHRSVAHRDAFVREHHLNAKPGAMFPSLPVPSFQFSKWLSRTPKRLTLRVLRRLAGSFQSDLLALFDAGVPCQKTGLFDHRAQLFVETAKRAGDAMSRSFGLASATTANDANVHVKPLSGVRQAKRLEQLELVNRTTPK